MSEELDANRGHVINLDESIGVSDSIKRIWRGVRTKKNKFAFFALAAIFCFDAFLVWTSNFMVLSIYILIAFMTSAASCFAIIKKARLWIHENEAVRKKQCTRIKHAGMVVFIIVIGFQLWVVSYNGGVVSLVNTALLALISSIPSLYVFSKITFIDSASTTT